MKILILGAARQIAQLLTQRLFKETDAQLILYTLNATSRMRKNYGKRVRIVEGKLTEYEKLVDLMRRVDIVYLDDMNSPDSTKVITKAAKTASVSMLIGTTILGIYDEVIGDFGKWTKRMIGPDGINRHKASAKIIEESGIEYTLLRLTWLYNDDGNEAFVLTEKGDPFVGAQVTREAVARCILMVMINPKSYRNKSLGIVEPHTNFAKPSFY